MKKTIKKWKNQQKEQIVVTSIKIRLYESRVFILSIRNMFLI